MIVVDASLVAKWFIDEAGSDAAGRFRSRHAYVMVAPDLLLSEVASAIVRRANIDKTLHEKARTGLADWRQILDKTVIRVEPMEARAIEDAGLIALDLGHPLSDCVYLQLAIELGCELATCDAKFRIKALSRYDRVRLLHQFDD